jgi:2-polyprenyl-6-methoxyphenol hydroxylase-like FAD-dependent oxidoreductase
MSGGTVTEATDVVVVGGGIGGASLACALARSGLGVTVLEASARFDDRVRGEVIQPWGVKEARDLGVGEVLLGAGAHVSSQLKQYVAGFDEPNEVPLSMMVAGIPGTLNLAHPVACQALIEASAAAGATVVRSVTDVVVCGGLSPSVSYCVDGAKHDLRGRLVIGADGRASTVRQQVGIALERQEPITFAAGLLLDGLDAVPDDFDVLVAGDHAFFALFHQGGGQARAYLFPGLSGRHRFSGPGRVDAFLAACHIPSYLWSAEVAGGRPSGPVKMYPGDDTWTPTPFAEGVVLIGDAAGYNDPIIGQGLSIALRDARIVCDLVLDGAAGPNAFSPYGQERMARMLRLRLIADVVAVAYAEDAVNRPARQAFLAGQIADGNPEIMGLLIGSFAGPEVVPDDLLGPDLLDRVRAQ